MSLLGLVLVFSMTVGVATTPAQQDDVQSSQQWLFSGEINNQNPFDLHQIEVGVDGDLRIDMRYVPDSGDSLDTYVYLLDENNIIIDFNDDRTEFDDPNAGIRDSLLRVNNVAPGTYNIVATRVFELSGTTTGEYTLDVSLNPKSGQSALLDLYDVSPQALAAAGYPQMEPRPRAEWAVLAYYGADTNLEGDILTDFVEFEVAGGSTEDVRILALIDRHPEEDTSNGDWTDVRLFEAQPDVSNDYDPIVTPTIDSEPLAILGELDTGDGETLAQYLTWAVQTYPANNYVVSFGSHGAGWYGVVQDDSSRKNRLSLPELRTAFETAKQATGIEGFTLLINDACLMASIEYYDMLSDYFAFSLGAAELTISPAMDMTLLTNTLRNAQTTEGSVNINQLGRELVDQYINEGIFVKGAGAAGYFNIALTNLDRFDAVTVAIEDFADLVITNPETYIRTLTRARANTYTYAVLSGDYSYIDLGDFMRQIISFSDDFRLTRAAERVLNALGEPTIYGNAGDYALQRTTYYNIFFPDRERNLTEEYFTETPLIKWSQMLRTYFNYAKFEPWTGGDLLLTFHVPDTPQVKVTRAIPQTASFNTPTAVNIEVVATNISRGSFIVDAVLENNSLIRLSNEPLLQDLIIPGSAEPARDQNVWRSGVDKRTVSWPAAAYRVTDGEVSDFEFLQKSIDGQGTYFMDAEYRANPEGDWQDVKVAFSPDPLVTYDLRLSSIVSAAPGSGTVGVFSAQPGSQIRPYRLFVDAADPTNTSRQPGSIYTVPEGGLVANYDPVPTGEYVLRFEVESFGRGVTQDEIFVPVNNDSINADVRGQNFIERFGLVAGVPVAWSDFEELEGRLTASTYLQRVKRDDENPFQSRVYATFLFYDSDTADLEQFLQQQLVVYRAPLETTFDTTRNLGGRTVREYSYVSNEEVARGFVTYDEARDLGVVFVVGDRLSNQEVVDEAYEFMTNAITFFDGTGAETGADWDLLQLAREFNVPVPGNWQMESAQVGDIDLTVFQPADDEQRFAATAVLDTPSARVAMNTFLAAAVPDRLTTTPRTYNADQRTWESTQYTIDRNGVEMTGRIYATSANDDSYIAWVETTTDEARTDYNAYFEPLVSGITIEELFYEEDYSETLGVTFERPSPSFEDDPWLFRLYDNTTPVMYFSNIAGTKRIEIYPLDNMQGSTPQAVLDAFQTVMGESLTITSDIEAINVSSRPALEFDAQVMQGDIEWNGHYFVSYDASRNLGLVMGIRGTVDIDDAYDHLRDSTRFSDGTFQFVSPIQDREVYDPVFGYEVNVPAFWQPMTLIPDEFAGIDRIWTASQTQEMRIYTIKNGTDDLATAVENMVLGRVKASEYRPIEIDGRAALEFEVAAGSLQGTYFAIYDPDRRRNYMVGAQNFAGGDYLTIYEALRDSFHIVPLDG